jgi:hypothetical protein
LFSIDCAIDKLLILASVVPLYRLEKDCVNVSKIKVAFLELEAKACNVSLVTPSFFSNIVNTGIPLFAN